VILVENVVEVVNWVMWPAWHHAMELLGYEVRIVSLNSMVAWSGKDGLAAAPQSRDRVYVVCWRRGMRGPDIDITPPVWCARCERRTDGHQAWKNGRTVGKYRQQYVYVCSVCRHEAAPLVMPAASAIDWSINCPRIGDRAKPLVDNTRRRIAAGLAKFGPHAVVAGAGNTFERRPGVRTWSVMAPLPTQMTSAQHGLATAPFIAELRGGGSDARGVDEPLCTVTASGNHHGLVVPFTVDYHGNGRPSAATQPLPTVDCRDRHALVRPDVEVDDCGFRMLTPAEIGRAQAFPESYLVQGKASDKVRQYGNAVSPPAAALLAERVMEVL